MKRFLFLLFASLLPFVTWAYSFSAVNDDGVTLYYDYVDQSAKTVELTVERQYYSSTYTGVVNIPSTAVNSDDGETYTVVGIGSSAFQQATVTSVTIPETVTSIGSYAFEYCSSLTELVVPNTVTELGLSTFNHSGLISLTLPEALEAVPDNMVASCTSLASIDIPSTVTSIGSQAFNWCSSLTEIKIPDGVTSIGNGAFSYCTGITELVVPSGVTSIGSSFCANCTSLANVSLPEGITLIDGSAFASCTSLTKIDIPNSVESFGTYAFQYCPITEITIPENVTTIKQGICADCTELKTVNYNATACPSVDNSSYPPFLRCTALTEVNIGENVTLIPNYIFSGITGLTSVTIPASVTSIATNAFGGSSRAGYTQALTSVTALPTTPPDCAEDAFAEDYIADQCALYVPCDSKDDYSAVAPWSNFMSITGLDCPEPTKFEVDGIYYQTTSSKEVEVTASGGSAYSGNIDVPSDVVYNGDTYTVIGIGEQAFVDCTKLTGISLPSTLKYIGDYAFSFDSDATPSLTEIVIPESCTSIGEYAFQYCSSLASVTLPSGLTEIATGTFYYCALTTIEIPAAVTSLGVNAFRNCKSLTSVTCLAVEPPTCVRSANGVQTPFYNVTISDLPLYVPSGSEDAYKAADVWQDFGTIEAIGGSSEGTPLEDGATLEYDGLYYKVTSSSEQEVEVTATEGSAYTGDIEIPASVDYENVTYHVIGIGADAFKNATITSIDIPSSVGYIGNNAFGSCPLTSLVLPEGLETIGTYAFYYSTLQSVSFPVTLTSIGSNAFDECSSLTTVTFAEGCGLTSLGTYAFHDCKALTSISLPDYLTEIPNYAFQNCSALAEVTIGSSVTSIGTYSFQSCVITSIEIPASVLTIGSSFYQCKSLESVTFAEGSNLTTIDGMAFYQCTALKSIVIPDKVTSIGRSAFQGCSSLEEVTIGAGVEKLGDGVFYQCYSPMTVTALPTTPPSCGDSVFDSATTSDGILYVPCDSKDLYADASTWKNFANIEGIDCEDEGHGYSADDPFEVSEVIALAETLSSSDTVEGVYVKGIVSEIGSFYSNYGDLDYYISDDGTTDNQFYIYNGYYLDGEKFTSADQIKVTDTVIVTGNLTNYQGTTPELARGSKIVYLEEGEGTTIGGLETFENGSFEEWDGSYPVGWKSTTTASNATLTQSTDAQEGNYSAEIPHSSSNQRLASKEFLLPAGTYTISFYAKPAETGSSTIVEFGYAPWNSSSNSMGTYQYISVDGNQQITVSGDSWTKITGEFTLSEETQVNLVVMCQNKSECAALVDNYTIVEGSVTEEGGDHEYSIDPEEGVQTSLQKFTLYTPDGVCADLYGSSEYDFTVYLYKDGASEPYASTSDIDSKFDTSVTWNGDCELYFTFAEAITEAGEYEFVIPANSFYWVTDEGYNMELNDELRFSYTVEGGSEHEYSIDPEEGVQTSLQKFTLFTPDGVCADLYGSSEYDFTVYLYKDGASEPYASTSDIDSKFDTSVTWNGDCELYFTFDSEITEAGEYEFVIPANSFYWVTDEGYNMELNDELRFSYTVEGSTGFEYTVIPAEGVVESLSTIEFTTEVLMSGNSNWHQDYVGTVYVYKDGGTDPVTQSASITGEYQEPADADYGILITLQDEITEAGEYEVVIPAGLFYWYNNDDQILNEEITLYYTVEPTVSYEMVVSPADGDVETEVSEIVVSCEDGMEWNVNQDFYFTVTNDKDEVVAGVWDAKLKEEGDNDIILSYSLPLYDDSASGNVAITLTEAGNYKFTIPAGAFYLGDNKALSEEVTVNFTIEEAVSFSDFYSLDPEEGVVESLSSVKFTPLEDAKIAWSEKVDVDQVKVYKDGDTTTAVAYGASVDHPYSGSYDEYDEIFFNVTLTDPGEYEVVFPYNSFVYNNNGRTSCEEFSLHYTIEDNFSGWGVPSGYIVDPDDESYVETLKTINISYDGAGLTCADAVYAGATGVVMSKTGGQVATVSFEDGWDDDLNLAYVIATLSEEISELGTYYVTFPEKVFMHWDDYGTNPEFIVTYYVTGSGDEGGSEHEYSIDPEDGSVQSSLQVFTLSTPDGVVADEYASSEYDFTVYLYKDGASEPYASTSNIDSTFDTSVTWNGDCELIFTFAEAVTEAGEYEFVIPANSFYWVTDEGYNMELNDELRFSYTVDGSEAVEPGTFVCVVDPVDGSDVEELAQVAFYNPTEDEEIFVNDELARDPEIYVYNEAGDVVTTISYFDTLFGNNGEEYTQIVVFEDAVTEGGTYTVSVPAEMFIIYDEDNRPYYSEAMTLTYTIVGTGTGIGGISINDENVEGIYSTSGQKLNSTVKGVNIIRYSDGSVKKLYVK